jgi:hypothetical protein
MTRTSETPKKRTTTRIMPKHMRAVAAKNYVPTNPMDKGEMVMDPARRALPPQTQFSIPDGLKPFVIMESPYAGDIERNERYARAALRHCILMREAPFASHLLYTQPGVLRDTIHEERELGMGLGWHVMRRADFVAVYADLGFSSGMIRGVQAAMKAGLKAKMRFLGGEWAGLTPPNNRVPLDVLAYLIVED